MKWCKPTLTDQSEPSINTFWPTKLAKNSCYTNARTLIFNMRGSFFSLLVNGVITDLFRSNVQNRLPTIVLFHASGWNRPSILFFLFPRHSNFIQNIGRVVYSVYSIFMKQIFCRWKITYTEMLKIQTIVWKTWGKITVELLQKYSLCFS